MALVLLVTSGCGASSDHFRSESAKLDRVLAADREATSRDGATLFPPEEPLTLDGLISAVLDRNPSIEAARLAWQAALASYPEATSFEDPTLAYVIAPLSIGSDEVDFGQVVEISQPLPFPGKRALRGEVVVAEAVAARHDYQSVRLKLAGMIVSR